ncbi:hypothetical protein [Roseomonas indoligenes]|uniref:Uncharacterized protein n=1 Tax=Roseomonas indoligenes TaxID=2820811 RepID=A0A940N0Q7_9PROT|nr:hypothetical protein [Pararoseomonas indoligenes]MBP0494394.1 hypothetical protein [Pararoseomonas indoligenes]
MMRWALGLAVLFAVLALVARVLQFGFSVALLVVAGIALVAALVTGLMAKAGAGRDTPRPPPDR